MATHSSPVAGKSHGQRSLAGYNPRGCTESDMIEEAEQQQQQHRVGGGFPGGSDGKDSACSARDTGSIPGSWKIP